MNQDGSGPGKPPSEAQGSSLPLFVAAATMVLALAAFYLWSVHDPSRLRFQSISSDYYSLQVHGWLKGTLAMDVEPHPDLQVEFPNKIVGAAPYLLDASYYQGKYYLYFGPVPALVLLLPYHWATGHDLPEPVTAIIFVTLGLALSSAWLYLLLTRVLSLTPSPLTLALSVLALGVANMAPATLVRPLFYEIAVGSGYAFTQASLLAATLALLRPGREIPWLVVASLCAGLAAGSRPNLIVGAAFLLPCVVAACWWRTGRAPGRLLRLLTAGGVPVAVIVAGLLLYNQARFDRWFEFGNNLQLGANPDGFGFSLANFWHNLRVYYLTAPALDWFFPFVAPGPEAARPPGYFGIEEAHGQLLLVPFFVLTILAGWARFGAQTHAGQWGWILLASVGAAVVNFSLVASSGVRTNRYMMDFQPALVVVTLAILSHAFADQRRWLRGVSGVAAGMLVMACAYNVLISFHAGQRFLLLDPAGYSAIERRVNAFVEPVRRTLGPELGEQRWRVTFPEATTHRIEPLFVAGSIVGHDALYVAFLDQGKARLYFEHTPHGMIPGPEFAYVPGVTAELTLRLGTLYPPLYHPWYGNLPATTQQQLRREIRVWLDGKPVFMARAATYPSTLANAWIGERGIGLRGESEFSGQIEPAQPPGPVETPKPPTASAEFRVTLPKGMAGHREPLLSFGNEAVRMGDAIFIEYVDAETIRLGYDSSGEVAFSRPIAVSFENPVRIGYRHEPSARDRTRQGLIQVWINESLAWAAPLWSRPVEDPVWLPFTNPAFSSSARQLFTGVIHEEYASTPSEEPEAADLLIPLNPGSPGSPPLDGRQSLLTWTQASGASALLESEAINGSSFLLRLTDPLLSTEAGIEVTSQIPSQVRVIRTGSEIVVFIGPRPVLRHSSPFFEGSPIRTWLGGKESADDARIPEYGGAPARLMAPDLRTAQAPRRGPVTYQLLLPKNRTGYADPLLVAGPAGRADAVYVRYASDASLILGLDHWGVGGIESSPIPVDYEELHTLTIDFDALQADAARRIGRIRATLNGRVIWDAKTDSYPYTPEPTAYGENPIGVSSCGPAFTGLLLSVQATEP